eukprot:3552986-Lingulodinium_polyedra.AAC.1
MACRRFAGRFPSWRQTRAIALATSMLRGGVCGPTPPNIRGGCSRACRHRTRHHPSRTVSIPGRPG